jgi:hypothetical protein
MRNKRIFKPSTMIVLLLVCIACGGVQKNIAGDYAFHSASGSLDLTLQNDGKFIYAFTRDSFCHGTIRGKYVISGRKIKFENDYYYTDAYHQYLIDSLNAASTDSTAFDIVFLDFDMALVDWKIQKQSIQPLRAVKTPCLEISEKHMKVNENYPK